MTDNLACQYIWLVGFWSLSLCFFFGVSFDNEKGFWFCSVFIHVVCVWVMVISFLNQLFNLLLFSKLANFYDLGNRSVSVEQWRRQHHLLFWEKNRFLAPKSCSYSFIWRHPLADPVSPIRSTNLWKSNFVLRIHKRETLRKNKNIC